MKRGADVPREWVEVGEDVVNACTLGQCEAGLRGESLSSGRIEEWLVQRPMRESEVSFVMSRKGGLIVRITTWLID